jgi:WD40 repeat protein/serine/threonine protein kinase
MKIRANAWNIGDIIQDLYEVTEFLGEGGFGKVYKVRHQRWNIDLAVKSPKPQVIADQNGIENFEREAETWANLGLHPHIVTCYYVRNIENCPLVFAEYVAGGSLRDWIRQRKLYLEGTAVSLRRILDIAIQFAWGLQYAHEQGFIHQDVKPENVMLTSEGVVKVTDFGLANARTIAAMLHAQMHESSTNTMLVTGSGAMTPAYCSPEQANRKTLTRRTDLWSWALSVLEMFQGEITWASGVLAAYVLEDYLQNGSSDPDLPKMPIQVASLLQRCFRENPDDRPHNMNEVAAELQNIYQQVVGLAYPRLEPKASKDIADSLNNKAISLLDLGRQDQALELWQQALQIQPQHQESTYNQGLFLWQTGKITDESLVKVLEEARKSHSKGGVIDQLLTQVHLERDDCEAAIEILLKIQESGLLQEEAQAVLEIAEDRLPNSKRLLRTFEAQPSGINSICLSTDNRLALSGTWGKTLILWEVSTGKYLRTFADHTGQVNSVCLSTDSHIALSGSDDNTVKLWEVSTGKCLRTFKGHRDQINSVCLSTDSHIALSGSDDNTVKLWEVSTGKCLRTFKGHRDQINSVCLSTDSRFALSGSRDNTVKLWEVSTGQCLRTFEGHQDQVNSVCLSSDSQFVLSGSDDSTLKLWAMDTGLCLHTTEEEISGVYSICLSTDSRFALSGNRDNTVKLWEIATGRCLRTFQGHTSLVTSVCLSADGQFAVSSEIEHATVRMWAISGWTNRYVAPMMLSRVMATETVLSLNQVYEQELAKAKAAWQQGKYVVTAQHIRQARSQPGYSRSKDAFDFWNRLYIHLPCKALNGSWESSTLNGHISRISSLSVSQNGRFILSGSGDKTLKLWEIETRQCIRTFSGHKEGITSVSLSADGHYAISAGGNDCNLKQWNVESGDCLRTFRGFGNHRKNIKSFMLYEGAYNKGERIKINSVCLSADGRLAFTGSSNENIAIWEVSTRLSFNFLQRHIGKWEVSKSQLLMLLEEHQDEVTSVCLSADGQFILSGSMDNTVKLWEIATGNCLHTFAEHTDEITAVSLSADSQFALSGSNDRTLKLWDISTQSCKRCIHTYEGHTDRVTAVSLSVNGLYALSGSNDKTMKLWELTTGQCLRTFEGYAEAVTAVSLTPDGCYAISGSNDGTLKLWSLDWELEDRTPADWDEGAQPYLKSFLIQHTPYLRQWFRTSALQRRGKPNWSEENFQKLLYILGCAGYGWLRPEGVRRQLEAMAASYEC